MKCSHVYLLSAAICSLLIVFPVFAQLDFVQHQIAFGFTGANTPAIGDLNGDGNLDVVASAKDSVVSVWINLGVYPAQFTPGFPLSADYEKSYGADVVDVDGDGDLDILGISGIGTYSPRLNIHSYTLYPVWWENSGGFVPSFTLHYLRVLRGAKYRVLYGDMDGDGDIDLIVPDEYYYEDAIDIHENLGNGEFTTDYYWLGVTYYDVNDIKIGDIDGDGLPDIVMAAHNSHNDYGFVMIQNLGSLEFSEQIIIDPVQDAMYLDLADLDSDGDLDIVGIYGFYRNMLVWYENDGEQPPGFNIHVIEQWARPNRFKEILAVDLNNDGFVDIVSARDTHFSFAADGEMFYWLNEGGGTFSPSVSIGRYSGGSGNDNIKSADLDGDGDMDLVVCVNARDDLNSYGAPGRNLVVWCENLLNVTEVESFSRVAPEYGTHQDDPEVEFVWESTRLNDNRENEIVYHLYVAETHPDEYVEIAQTTDTSFVYHCPDDGLYWWAVKAESDLGPSRWADGDYWYFTVGRITDVQGAAEGIPAEFAISSIYPNPFNSSTNITIALPEPTSLDVRLIDLLGREVKRVADDEYSPGTYTFSLDASNLSSGVYFIIAQIPGERHVMKKVVLLH